MIVRAWGDIVTEAMNNNTYRGILDDRNGYVIPEKFRNFSYPKLTVTQENDGDHNKGPQVTFLNDASKILHNISMSTTPEGCIITNDKLLNVSEGEGENTSIFCTDTQIHILDPVYLRQLICASLKAGIIRSVEFNDCFQSELEAEVLDKQSNERSQNPTDTMHQKVKQFASQQPSARGVRVYRK